MDQEIQRQAQETITKVIEQESQKRLDVIGRQKAEIEAQQASGAVGEREAQRQITELTIKELNERKAAQEKIRSEQQAFGNIEAVRKAGEEIKKIEADISKAVAEERDKRNAELIKNFEEQQSIIEGYLAQVLSTEENFNNQRTQLQLQGLDEQIKQQQQALGRLSASDKEGREAINAAIGKLQADRQKIIQEGYEQELETFSFHWGKLWAQFGDDVFHTEEIQIIDAIKLQLLMNRCLRFQYKNMEQIEQLESMVAKCNEEIEDNIGDREYVQGKMVEIYERLVKVEEKAGYRDWETDRKSVV